MTTTARRAPAVQDNTTLEARLAELTEQNAVLTKQVKDIDQTIQYLVNEYGTEWCEEGREDVNTRLMRVGLSPICKRFMLLAFELVGEFDYSDFRTHNGLYAEARAALAKLGVYPVSGNTFNGDPFQICDEDGDV